MNTFNIMFAAAYQRYNKNVVGGSKDLATGCQSAVTMAFGADISVWWYNFDPVVTKSLVFPMN